MRLARRLLRRPTIVAGSSSSPLFTFVAIFAPLLEPYPMTAPSGAAFAPPSAAHWLGCDDAGVDMLSLVIAGTQNSMLVGFAAAVVAVAHRRHARHHRRLRAAGARPASPASPTSSSSSRRCR